MFAPTSHTLTSPSSREANVSSQLPAAVKKGKKVTMSLDEFRLQRIDEPATSAVALASFEPEVRAVRPHPKTLNEKYDGKISPRFFGAQYLCINHVRNVILFSQQTVSDFNKGEKCDYPLDMLVDALFVEFKKDLAFTNEGCLDVVDNGDGTFTSIDNRRLFIAKKIGLIDSRFGIWIKVHPANQELTEGQAKRFQGAKTWGQAAANRVNNPRIKGYLNYPTIKDEGKDKDPQSLQLDIREINLSGLDSKDVATLRSKAKNGIVTI